MLIRLNPGAAGEERILHIETGTVIRCERLPHPRLRYCYAEELRGEEAVAAADALGDLLDAQDAALADCRLRLDPEAKAVPHPLPPDALPAGVGIVGH